MANTASRLVDVALAEVGYLEKRSARDEDSKTANAGSANFTKYGRWIGCDGDYWCASFVCWCFHEAFGEDGRRLCLTYSPSCEVLRGRFRKAGRYDTTPRRGDLVFFSGTRHGGANHVGVVTGVTATHVETVEGNTSGGSAVVDNGGGVARKRYALGNARILGYGHPAYDRAVAAETDDEGEGLEVAKLPNVKYGTNGGSAKAVQALLKAKYGKKLTVDGKFGTNSQRQLKAVQGQLGLAQDGVCGERTWRAMLL